MLEKYTDQMVGAMLAGAGAILTAALAWSWKRANEWWKRPRIAIEVGNGEGYISETVLIKTATNCGLEIQTEREAIFVRTKVTNNEGAYRTPEKARGCA